MHLKYNHECFYKTYDMGLEVDDQTKHDENENRIYYMERRPKAKLKLLHIFLPHRVPILLLLYFFMVLLFSPLE